MNTNSKEQMGTGEGPPSVSAEQRLKELAIKLPPPPEPFGTYVEAVQTGNLLFLSGMLPTEGHAAKIIGRVGAELDVETGRKAARLAALNVLAVARQHLGSLDKVTRLVRLGVSVATSGDIRDQPKVADAASELLRDVFGKDKSPCRLVYGVTSLPLGTPVELEVIFEIAGQGHRKQYSRASAAVVGAPQQSLKLYRRIMATRRVVPMAATQMKVAQISKPGAGFEMVEREIPEPSAGQVRIKVQACGVCHSDVLTVEGSWPGIQYPRVPGHEVAGIIDEVGSG